MYSILSLVGCILCSVFILFMYGIEFMSFIYLVVYIGAIAILFLFMIMMLNINSVNTLSYADLNINFFLYICIFFKTIYSSFLANKDFFLFYLDNLNKKLPLGIHYGSDPLTLKTFFGDSEFFLWLLYDLGDVYTPFYKQIDPSVIVTHKSSTDNLVDFIFSYICSSSDMVSFCALYNVFILYLTLAGMILLFAMFGSISLCIIKSK